jgi:hypothetical protein
MSVRRRSIRSMKRPWTESEDQVLRECYPSMTAAAIATMLPGRTLAAIRIRAHRDLGIDKAGPSRIDRDPPSTVDRAYTAGMVDGEGSIQINASVPTKGGKAYWSLTVQITGVGVDFIRALRDVWGIGSITMWKPKLGRLAANWRIYSEEAEWFLRAIEPFLRLKREHALVALEFRTLVGSGPHSLTPELSEQRSRLAEQMRELNAKTGKATAKPRTNRPL